MTMNGIKWQLEGNAEEFNRSNEEQALIAHLEEAGMQTPKEISDALGVSYNTIKQRLFRMKNRGVIRTYGGKYWVEAGKAFL